MNLSSVESDFVVAVHPVRVVIVFDMQVIYYDSIVDILGDVKITYPLFCASLI